MIYEVGKPFYLDCPNPCSDFALIQPVDGGTFDILMYMKTPSFNEKLQAKTGKLQYGIFESSNIPFFIVKFESFSFDASMNMLKLPFHKRNEWLSENKNGVTLFLIDSMTNIIKSIRFIGLNIGAVNTFKSACSNQIKHYKTPEDIEKAIENICKRYTTSQMLDHSHCYDL